MANDSAMHNAAKIDIADQLGELIADANRAESTSMGLHHGHQEAHQRFLAKKGAKDTVLISHRNHAQGVPAELLEQLDADIRRADFERKAAYDASSRHSKTIAIPAKECLREAEIYVTTHPQYLQRVAPPVIKAEPRKVLDESAEAIASRRREKRACIDLPPPMAEVLNSALHNLDRACLPVMPTVGDDGSLAWDAAARGIDIRGHDSIVHVFDPQAFWLAVPGVKATVAAHIEKEVRARYAGITDTATDAEKRKRIAVLDREILDLQRLQVAAIRAIRATGEWVPFPAGIDVRAVLNVEGPKPRSRN